MPTLGLAQGLNGALTRGLDPLHSRAGRKRLGLGWQGNRPLLVRRVAAIAGGQDQILTGFSSDHEFLAGRTADGTTVGLDGDGPQATTLKDPAVGLVHQAIGLLQAVLVGVERIGVLHDEFAPTHQTEAGTNLIAKLGLHLIQVDRELPVGTKQISGECRDDLLVGRAETELATLTVLKVKHDPLAVGVPGPAPAALPELRRLELGQERLQGTRRVEFLADNG